MKEPNQAPDPRIKYDSYFAAVLLSDVTRHEARATVAL
jgi:hypothetical protein